MSDKMMSEREIVDRYINRWPERICIEHIVKDSRLGTIPAENAIVVPDEQFWPSWASGVRLIFEEGKSWSTPAKVDAVSTTDQKIACVPGRYIPRPVPAFVPFTPEDYNLFLEFEDGSPCGKET